MVVAMHRTESSKKEIKGHLTKTLPNPKHPLQITNMFYFNNLTHDCLVNDIAKREIEEFLAGKLK